MRTLACLVVPITAAALLLVAGEPARPRVRATGVIRAVHSVTILVPRIPGLGGNLTLATLARNGSSIQQGDLIAAFDRTNELKLLQDSQSKLDDLNHQIETKKAEQTSNIEKRISDLQGAEADLKKAVIEGRKGPVLSEIERQKNEVRLADAREHVASLERSNRYHQEAEQAELRVLELQRDRQQLAVQQQIKNSEQLLVHAPIRGMLALVSTWRNNSMGHAQEGDQLWPGSPLLKVFDPAEMEIQLTVGEPDGAVLVKGARGTVHLDAFPDLAFRAHFASASPVATAALGTPVKTFTARFVLDQSDPHLLPDLSAAVDIEAPQ
ncbi:MAG TPA: HlyD family efflux transporter periplasmic adaptor subunit [Bryobacteraceae bacterium]|nr:HlyD family efflux transporter periplasmic adaptor subunit [Bryobacteraceae bacterium]